MEPTLRPRGARHKRAPLRSLHSVWAASDPFDSGAIAQANYEPG